MTYTLEQLNISMTEEYWPARAAKVTSIAAYLTDRINPGLSAEGLAEHFMDLAFPMKNGGPLTPARCPRTKKN